MILRGHIFEEFTSITKDVVIKHVMSEIMEDYAKDGETGEV